MTTCLGEEPDIRFPVCAYVNYYQFVSIYLSLMVLRQHMGSGPEVIKLFSCSTHGIFPAHKC